MVAQVLTMLEPSEPLRLGWLSGLLASTVWGRAWVLQVVAVLVAGWGFRRACRPTDRKGWSLALAGAMALAVTPALSGHAVATPNWALLAVAADTVHILAAGGWMGGLAVLLLVGLPTILRRQPESRAVAASTSRDACRDPSVTETMSAAMPHHATEVRCQAKRSVRLIDRTAIGAFAAMPCANLSAAGNTSSTATARDNKP